MEVVGDVLVLRFSSGERLVVTDPRGVRLAADGGLVVADASDERFGWHFYGGPQTAENWCEQIYRRDGPQVDQTRLGPLMPGESLFAFDGPALVALEPMT